MKRYQAIIIAVAALIGTSYVGATYAASTEQRVELRCGVDTAVIEGDVLHWRGVDYLEPAGGSEVMTFVRSGRVPVVLRVSATFIFLTQGDNTVSCDYVD